MSIKYKSALELYRHRRYNHGSLLWKN